MADLYEILGVGRTATMAQIQAAFRRRSKKLHPDAGGDQKAFAELCHARDVLSDEARRARYDQTGDAEDNHDAEQRKKKEIVMHLMAQAIVIAIKQGHDINSSNYASLIKRMFQSDVSALEEGIKESERFIAKFKDVCDKFKKKGKGENVFAAMAERESNLARSSIDAANRQIESLKIAIDEIDDYSYEAVLQIGDGPYFRFKGFSSSTNAW